MYLAYFLCVDYCRFKTTSRPIADLEGGNNGASIAIGIVLFPLIRKLELRQEEYRN
jgi:hypothetical protein